MEMTSKSYLSLSWRPSDLDQRAGRGVRQGNKNPEIDIYRYVTEGTFDAYLWQTVENKQKFISQIMTSKSPLRACEDVDETALSYAEIKALCSGNPLIKEKIDLDIEVARLRLLKSDHENQQYRLEDSLLKQYPEAIKSTEERISGIERDLVRLEAATPKPAATPAQEGQATVEPTSTFSPMVVQGITYSEKAQAGKALLDARKSVKGRDPVHIGSYRGFDMLLSYDSFYKKFELSMKGDISYPVELGDDTFGNITRINNLLAELPKRLASSKVQLENLHKQVADAEQELKKPFELAGKLAEKESRLAWVNAELNIDEPEQADTPVEAHDGQQYIAKGRPSILDTLRHSLPETPELAEKAAPSSAFSL